MGALSVSELRFAGYILISFLQTRLKPQSPRPAMIRIAVGGPTCPDRTPIIITPTGPVPMHMVTIPITRDRVARGRAGARQDTPVLPVAGTDLGDGGFNAGRLKL